MEDFSGNGVGTEKRPQDCISVNIQNWVDSRYQDLKDIIADLKQTIDSRVDAKFESVEEKIAYQAKSVQIALDKAFESAQLAIQKLEMATQAKFDSHNEFRLQLKEQVATFATRKEFDDLRELLSEKMSTSEYENRHSSIEGKIDTLAHKIDDRYTKMEINELLGVHADEVKKVSDRQWILVFGIIIALMGLVSDIAVRIMTR